MRFLSVDQSPEARLDFEGKESCALALLACLISLAVCLGSLAFVFGLIPHGPIPELVFNVVAAFTALLTAATVAGYRATLGSLNWLCRVRGNALWIKCSRFWCDIASKDILIIELDRSEVAWMQPRKLHFVFRTVGNWRRGWGGTTSHEFYTYLDIVLSKSGAAQLQPFAKNEQIPLTMRQLIAPPDNIPACPARVVDGTIIRLCWKSSKGAHTTPGIDRAVQFFSRWTEVRPMCKEKDRW